MGRPLSDFFVVVVVNMSNDLEMQQRKPQKMINMNMLYEGGILLGVCCSVRKIYIAQCISDCSMIAKTYGFQADF